jgi:hypothetical protein
MAQLYLPAAHTEADLVLAGQIAESIDSSELYVTWTAELGNVVPEVVAVLREQTPAWPSLFFQAVRELWAAFRGRPMPPAQVPAQPAAPREAAA